MFRTVIANISRRKLRMLATSLAVLLGVMFTSGTLVLTDSLNHAFDELFTDTYAQTSVVVQSGDTVEGGIEFGNMPTRGELPAELVDQTRSIPGVADAIGIVGGYTQIILPNGKALGNPNQGPPTMGMGWAESAAMNPYVIAEGHAPTDEGQVVLDRATSKMSHYGIGDEIPLITPAGKVTKTVVGLATVAGEDGTGGATAVLFTTEEAQRVLLRPGKFDEIRLEAEPGLTPAELVRNVESADLGNVEVSTGAEAAAQAKDDATAFLSFFSIFLLVFAAIALLVGGFIIANTFSILVAQRTRELALLRAIGASRRQVLLSVVAEAAVVGVVASAIGLVLGYGIAALLQSLLMGESSLGGATLTPRTVALSFAIGIGITVLSALLPARRAAKVPPVTAMRDAAVEDVSKGTVRAVLGVVVAAVSAGLLVLGALNDEPALVGFGSVLGLLAAVVLGPTLAAAFARASGRLLRRRGMAGKLGQENVLRNPKRTASTASALMIGATLVCAIAVFAASALASINKLVDSHFHGSVVVSSTGNGLPATDVERLTADGSLGTVAAMTAAPVEIDGSATLVTASDPAALEAVVDMQTQSGDFGSLGTTDVAVSEAKAEAEGWQVGTPLTAKFLDGSTQTLTIKAIYRNRLIAQDVFANTDAVKGSLLVPLSQIVFIKGHPGVSPSALKAEVDEMLADNPTAKVQTNAEFKETSAEQMNQFLMIVYAMLALAVIIAIIGIVNTLGLSIMERVRELGLLRAVGMTKKQLRTTVRIEALLIALTGTLIGIALGTAIGTALMKSFGPEQALTGFAIPTATLVTVLVAGVIVGFGAAIIPARRAARLDPLAALATD